MAKATQEKRRDVLTLSEAAAELGLSYPRTLTWIQRGELEATRAGKTWLITRDALDRFRVQWEGNRYVRAGRLGGTHTPAK